MASDVIYRAAHVPLLLHTLQGLVRGLERQGHHHRRTKKATTTALVAFDKRGREGVEAFLKAAAAPGSGFALRHVCAAEMPPGARFTHFGCVELTAAAAGGEAEFPPPLGGAASGRVTASNGENNDHDASAAFKSPGTPAAATPKQAASEPPSLEGLELAPHADGTQCGAPKLSLAAVAAARGGLKPTGLDRRQTAGARLDPGGSGQFAYRNFDGLAPPGHTPEGRALVALFDAHCRHSPSRAGAAVTAGTAGPVAAPAVDALPKPPALPPPALPPPAPPPLLAAVDWAALALACPAAHCVDAAKLQQRAPKTANTFAMNCLNGEYT